MADSPLPLPPSDPKPLAVELALPVQTYDIDFAGVVSNLVYIRWLEDLRLEILHRYCPLPELMAQGIAPVLLHTSIDYKQALQLGDRPVGKMWGKALESLRFTVAAEIVVEGKVVALAEQRGLFVNLQTKRPVRIPQALQQHYAAIA